MEDISRRSFLQGAAAMGAAAAVSGMAATAFADEAPAEDLTTVTTEEAATEEVAEEEAEEVENDGIGVIVDADSEEDADIVVVGSGIGGFMAAMIAKEQAPDATVIMLEKNGYLGGSTNYAECNGPQSNTDESTAWQSGLNSAANTGYIANSMLHAYRMMEAGDNADWLFGKHGVGWYQSGQMFYDGGNGSSCIETLTPIAEEEGVDIRMNSRATALLLEDEYTVTGVQYEAEDGSIVHVNCAAVILATGGMSTNKELLAEYSSQDMEKIIGWGDGQDGDGHLMAEQTAHGRANHLTVDSLFNNVGNGEESCSYESTLGVAAGMQYTDCFVNEYGLRFCDESGSGALGTTDSGKIIESQGYVFSIMGSDNVAAYEAGGCTRKYSGFADAMVGAEIDVQSEIDAHADTDYVFQADTLEELGELIAEKVDTFVVEDFVAEIEAYNGYCASGTDEKYGKAADYLWAIEEPPFYAFQICSGMLNTSGGIRINRNAQVTDARGKVVSGLYAAGVCTSGWDGECYGGGTCQTVGMWAGSKAARHAVENLLGIEVAEDWMGDVDSMEGVETMGGMGGGEEAAAEGETTEEAAAEGEATEEAAAAEGEATEEAAAEETAAEGEAAAAEGEATEEAAAAEGEATEEAAAAEGEAAAAEGEGPVAE